MRFGDGDVVDPLIRNLRALTQRLPDLKEAAELYEIVLPLLGDAEGLVASVCIPIDQVRAKLACGTPLLQGIELDLDCDKMQTLMLMLATALERNGGKSRRQYSRIKRVIEEGRLDAESLLASITAGDAVIASAAQDLQADPNLIRTLAHFALKPAMRLLCRQLTPLVEGIPWNRGYCFVCGSGASLGELRDHHLRKHLRCEQCGADWTFQRLRCSCCGNEDYHTLSLLYPDPWDGKARVEVCDQCKGYLKVIVSFTPTPADRLPIADLATLQLDYIAQSHGYKQFPAKPGGIPSWS